MGRITRLKFMRGVSPWAFLAPALLVFAVFKFWPTLYGMFLSFFNVRPYLGNQWIGFDNFTRAFNDPTLFAATWHTLLDAAVTVAASMLIGFFLALLLEGPTLHLRIVRTAAFLPVVTAMVVVAQLWDVLLYPGQYGAVNSVLGAVGVGPQGFLSDPNQALGSVMLVQIWKSAPYDMVIFIAGLAGVDRQLYDAADIDGASAWQRLRYVTIPALRPITTIVLTLGIIRGLRVFTEIFVLTNGGPAGSTETIVTFLYKAGIENNKLGYASAISTMLLIATVVLTCLNLWWRARKDRS
ncbi:MAG TPA: sugar ABC transporter permease [Microbacteriaceae bacterium]